MSTFSSDTCEREPLLAFRVAVEDISPAGLIPRGATVLGLCRHTGYRRPEDRPFEGTYCSHA